MDAVIAADDKVLEFTEEGDAALTELEGGGGCIGLLLPGPAGPPVGVVTPAPSEPAGWGGPCATRFIGLGFIRAAIGLSCEINGQLVEK